MVHWFVEEIANHCTEGTRQNEVRPEQQLREMRVQKYKAPISASKDPKTAALPVYPSPASSAVQSPKAVPSVCENMMVTQ
jgi:hypothetical protein